MFQFNMRCNVHHVMDIDKIKERLELALKLVEKPPSIEEVLEKVSTHSVLRGLVDWVFPAWMQYVEYAAPLPASNVTPRNAQKSPYLLPTS